MECLDDVITDESSYLQAALEGCRIDGKLYVLPYYNREERQCNLQAGACGIRQAVQNDTGKTVWIRRGRRNRHFVGDLKRQHKEFDAICRTKGNEVNEYV